MTQNEMLERIKIDGGDNEIDTKPITMLVAKHQPKIEYLERMVIDAEMTIYHGNLVQKLHSEFAFFWKLWVESASSTVDYEITATHIRTMSRAFIHAMGLIDLSLKFQDMKVPFAWVLPETYLYPSFAAALTDLVIAINNRGITNTKD